MKCIDHKFVRVIRIEQVLKAFNINLAFPKFSLDEEGKAMNLPRQINVFK